MEQRASWEADICSVCKAIHSIIWNTKVHSVALPIQGTQTQHKKSIRFYFLLHVSAHISTNIKWKSTEGKCYRRDIPFKINLPKYITYYSPKTSNKKEKITGDWLTRSCDVAQIHRYYVNRLQPTPTWHKWIKPKPSHRITLWSILTVIYHPCLGRPTFLFPSSFPTYIP